MAWYRALKSLSNGIGKGQVFAGNVLRASSLPVLEERKAIARISAPPLTALPGWKTRGEKLGKAGIVAVEDFLDGDAGLLAKALKAKPEQVVKWKEEVIQLLTVPKPKG